MNWKCPECGNVRRFCFPCSEAVGHLIRRVSVARESKAERHRKAVAAKRTLRRLSPYFSAAQIARAGWCLPEGAD